MCLPITLSRYLVENVSTEKRILERKVAQNPVFVQWFIGFISSKQTYEVFKTVHFYP